MTAQSKVPEGYRKAVEKQARSHTALERRAELTLIDCTKLEAPMTDHTPTLKNLIDTRRSQMNRAIARQRLLSDLKTNGC